MQDNEEQFEESPLKFTGQFQVIVDEKTMIQENFVGNVADLYTSMLACSDNLNIMLKKKYKGKSKFKANIQFQSEKGTVISVQAFGPMKDYEDKIVEQAKKLEMMTESEEFVLVPLTGDAFDEEEYEDERGDGGDNKEDK